MIYPLSGGQSADGAKKGDPDANFNIGSTKEEVRKAQGEPDGIDMNLWFFGNDYVSFSNDNRVEDYSNIFGTLRIEKELTMQ